MPWPRPGPLLWTSPASAKCCVPCAATSTDVIWWNPSAGSPSDWINAAQPARSGSAAAPRRAGQISGSIAVEGRPGDRHTVAEIPRELALGERAQPGEERLQEGTGAPPRRRSPAAGGG